ncbi:MAG TPA: hypothetical protein DCQ99_03210 [Nitrospinae bacterium]|nr:hypothetical protein [Nitrospinota bacterium]HBA26860.1 hypothetical protein [Nitrospinota bacterium]
MEGIMKKNILFIIVLALAFILYSKSSYSEIYKWMDDKGEAHFTDNPAVIPEQYLNQVWRKTTPRVLSEQPPAPPLLRENEVVNEKSPAPPKEDTNIKEAVSPNDLNAVTVNGRIKEEATEKKEKVIYSGLAKNNSNAELNGVEIIFTIRGKDGKEENLPSLIKGKKGGGILEQGETASFSVQPETPFPSIAGYGYSFKWRFTTTEPQK